MRLCCQLLFDAQTRFAAERRFRHFQPMLTPLLLYAFALYRCRHIDYRARRAGKQEHSA